MLSYDLCLKLQEAGYPHHPVNWASPIEIWIRNVKDNNWYSGDRAYFLAKRKFIWFSTYRDWDWETWIHIPNLFDLITRCGNKIYSIERVPNYISEGVSLGSGWLAIPFVGDYENAQFGRSPHIAVANLYLKIHGKE